MAKFFELAGVCVSLEGEMPGSAEIEQLYRPYERSAPFAPLLRVVLGAQQPHGDPVAMSVAIFGTWMTMAQAPDHSVRIGGVGNGSIESLLKHAFATFLAQFDAVVVHAAAVEGPQGAVAFVGPSEAGKTTAAVNTGMPVVGPDRVAMGFSSEGPWLAPLPFSYGEPKDGRTGPRRLDRLFFVEKADRNEIVSLAPRDRFGRFLPNVLLPSDAGLAARVVDLVGDLCVAVPVDVLRALKEGGFWPLVVASTRERGLG